MSNQEAIRNEMLNQIPENYQKTIGYPTYDIINAFAVIAANLSDDMKKAKDLLDVDNLTGDDLTQYVAQRKGIERKAATYAEGILTATGEGTINKGDLFESKGGVQYQAIETVTIKDTGKIAVRAVTSGLSGNVGSEAITEMPITITGISKVTNELPVGGGYEQEDDESLRTRFYEALRTPPTSGNIHHYKAWAKEVPGVGDAKVYPLARGDNTVEVVIIDAEKQPASDQLIDAVQKYIDPGGTGKGEGVAPIGAHCYVLTATALHINVTATITLIQGYTIDFVTENIRRNINEYLKEIAFVQDYVSSGKIVATINDCEGVLDYTEFSVQGSNSNVVIANKEVAILGEVTINVQG